VIKRCEPDKSSNSNILTTNAFLTNFLVIHDLITISHPKSDTTFL